MTEQDYKAIWLALDDPSAERNYIAKERLDVIKAEFNAMEALIDRHFNRIVRAANAWQKQDPARALIRPDFGSLMDWLMEKAGIDEG
jgi:hypothetical protein